MSLLPALSVTEGSASPSVYGLSAQFVLRMTGFPVDTLQTLNRAELVVAAERQASARARADVAQRALREVLSARGPATRKLRKDVDRLREVARGDDATLHPLIDEYNLARIAAADAAPRFAEEFATEYEAARTALYAAVRDPRFRTVLLYSSPSLERLVPPLDAGVPQRNTNWRQREVTWLSYLQRLTTKNDTISFYGPSVWGRVDAGLASAVDIVLRDEEIDARILYYERWPVLTLLDQIAADPEAWSYLRPLPASDLLATESGAELLGSNTSLALAREERALLARCDGSKTVAELGDAAGVRRLAEQGAVSLIPSLVANATPFDWLRELVAGWPEGSTRTRWSERLQRLEDCRAALAAAAVARDLDAQRVALGALQTETADLPLPHTRGLLYAARLPVNEDCRRSAERVRLGAAFIEQATVDVAPYYEMWRDLAGLYGTRTFEALRKVYTSLGGARVRLPVFVRACAEARLPFFRNGGVGMAPELYNEIQQAWADQLGARASEPEVTLTPADLSFVRDRFRFRRLRAGDRPAPDIQIAARDEAALHAGNFTMVLAEIHADSVMWQNTFLFWCRDVERLRQEYERESSFDVVESLGRPIHINNLMPHRVLLDQAPAAGVPTARAADVWVELDEDDLIARHDDGRLLGSLIDNIDVAHCTHQLTLVGRDAHSPRLRCGRVVVQRRSWRVPRAKGEVMGGESSEVYAAMQALRKESGWPFEVFAKAELPVRQTLHKAAKPIFIDFRNPLLVEALARQLRDYRAVEITEALPSTEECWLRDARGRYSCELRMIAHPAPDHGTLVAGGYAVVVPKG